MLTQGKEGFTLVELLIIISLTGLMMAAVPPLERIIGRSRQQSQIYRLSRLIQLTRSSAISLGKTVTLCGSINASDCVIDMVSPTVLVFEDTNSNRRLDRNEHLISQAILSRGHWYWHGSNRPMLRFRADGSAMEWGHFTLCPMSEGLSPVRIILNPAGRQYLKTITGELPQNETCS